VIKIHNVDKSYGDLKVLDNLSFHVKKGSIFGLLGANGAGKSTILAILNGLSDYEKGDIEIRNLELRSHQKEIREISSLVPQNLAFYERLSVRENLDFFSKIQQANKENYEKAIEINGLEEILDKRASFLSGGQKRRLNIAIGLLNNPKIIYFDEPTVGIDPQSRNEILESIKNYKKLGITVVYTSHYLNEVNSLCDEVAIISFGKCILQQEITPTTDLEKYFLGNLDV
jgi:ABC-2 type transport system ATP-binding protein